MGDLSEMFSKNMGQHGIKDGGRAYSRLGWTLLRVTNSGLEITGDGGVQSLGRANFGKGKNLSRVNPTLQCCHLFPGEPTDLSGLEISLSSWDFIWRLTALALIAMQHFKKRPQAPPPGVPTSYTLGSFM